MSRSNIAARMFILALAVTVALIGAAWIGATGRAAAHAPERVAGFPMLVVNEVDYDQGAGPDGAEFVEIKNTDTFTGNLSSTQIVLVDGNGGGATRYMTYTLPSYNLGPGQYYVVCSNAALVANCNYDVTPDTDMIQDGAPDAVALLYFFIPGSPESLSHPNGTIIDTVSYEGDTGGGFTEGSGAGLIDDGISAIQDISRFPDGVDTNVNNVDFSARCITPGQTNSSSICAATPTPTATNTPLPTDTPTPTPTDTPLPTVTNTSVPAAVQVSTVNGNPAPAGANAVAWLALLAAALIVAGVWWLRRRPQAVND
jgi:hypothetical protein